VRARRAIWIAGGILIIAALLAILLVKPRHVSARVLEETNGYRRVIIGNPTAQLYSAVVWPEFYANNDWERASLSNTFVNVAPRSSIETAILMPTNTATPKRIAFVFKRVNQSGLALWLDTLRTRLRLKPPADFQYVEVP
jgi:hypothetical protein